MSCRGCAWCSDRMTSVRWEAPRELTCPPLRSRCVCMIRCFVATMHVGPVRFLSFMRVGGERRPRPHWGGGGNPGGGVPLTTRGPAIYLFAPHLQCSSMYISPSCGGGARRRVGALSCSGGGGPVPSPNSRQDVPPPTPPPIPAAWRARGVVRQPAREQGRGEGGMSRAPAAAETGRGGRARAAEVPDDPPTPSRHRGDPRQRPRRGAAATAHRRAVGSGRASAPAPHTPPVKAPATSPTRPRQVPPPTAPLVQPLLASPTGRAGRPGSPGRVSHPRPPPPAPPTPPSLPPHARTAPARPRRTTAWERDYTHRRGRLPACRRRRGQAPKGQHPRRPTCRGRLGRRHRRRHSRQRHPPSSRLTAAGCAGKMADRGAPRRGVAPRSQVRPRAAPPP